MTERSDSLRVLLIEDDEPDADLIIHAIKRIYPDTQVDVIATRKEFIGLLARHQYDMVLADYRLPGWTGVDALQELRRLGFAIPLIIVTGMLGDERAVDCVKAGATDYVLKDNLARLPMVMKRAMDEKRAHDESRRAQGLMQIAQRAAREQETRFSQLADSIDEVFFVMDAQYRETLYINPAYERIWGRSRQSLYDNPKSFMEAFPDDDRVKLQEYIGRIQRGEKPGKLESRVIQPDGSVRWVLSHAVPIRNEHGEVYRISGVALDITESREAQLALEESAARALQDMTERRTLEDQFRQAQKMEAVGRLAGGVAHDFNNLLTVITGFTDMLITEFGVDDPRRADLQEVRKAADAASSLTRQLLAFSRLQVIEPRVITLEEVVKQSQKLLTRLIGEDIDLATHFGPVPSVVHMDPGQLEQVIMNLVVNSRDAMPTGGKLTIETAVVDLDETYAAAHWPATTGRYAMLTVSDTGTGMDEATRAKIFEPFFTTKESGKGTGLGLATVYGIVKQSDGFVWAYSEPGHGATFKIYLPLCEDAPASARDENGRQPVPRGTETVLVVEDSPAVRDIVRRVLEQQGYEVIVSVSPSDALELAARLDRPVHLLLTDVVMPEMSGRILAEKFATIQPGAAILYMSGYTDDAVIRHGVLAAKTSFLQKPFTPMSLAKRVRVALDSRAG